MAPVHATWCSTRRSRRCGKRRSAVWAPSRRRCRPRLACIRATLRQAPETYSYKAHAHDSDDHVNRTRDRLGGLATARRRQSAHRPLRSAAANSNAAGADDLSRKTARFAPTEITADISALAENERQALAHMIRAAQVMDALFLEQVWAGNEAMLVDLLRDQTRRGQGAAALLPDQQGPVVAARSQRAIRRPARRRSRRPPTTIPRARPRRKSRSGSSRCRRPRRRAPPASSRRSAAARTAGFVAVPTAPSIRASSRLPRSTCARRRSSRRSRR